jgi:hypothetical protein
MIIASLLSMPLITLTHYYFLVIAVIVNIKLRGNTSAASPYVKQS